MGSTVLAGAALEALLLWALKQRALIKAPKSALDELHLAELIDIAQGSGIIDEPTAQQASLAKDARNLIHPGRAHRSGDECSKATALTALAAIHHLSDALRKP